MSYVASGIAVGTGAIKLIGALSAHHKDQAALSGLKQPYYQVQSEFFQNKNVAEQMAGQGLPSAQRDYMTQGAERGLGSSLNAILRGGGDINAASMLLSKYNDDINKIGVEDSAQRLNNIQYFMKVNVDLAAEKEKQWSINEYQPYEAKLKELKGNIAQDKANEWGAVDSIGSAAISGINANQNRKLMELLYGTGKSGGRVPPPYNYNPDIASIPASSGVSPASQVGYIDPNSYSQSATVQSTDVSDNY